MIPWSSPPGILFLFSSCFGLLKVEKKKQILAEKLDYIPFPAFVISIFRLGSLYRRRMAVQVFMRGHPWTSKIRVSKTEHTKHIHTHKQTHAHAHAHAHKEDPNRRTDMYLYIFSLVFTAMDIACQQL